MHDLIERLRLHWEREGSLAEALSDDDVAALVASPAVQTACSRLSRDALGMAELSTNTARGKISLVEAVRDWSISVVKDWVQYEDVVLAPYPSILIPIDDRSTFSVDQYRADASCFHRSHLPDSSAVARIGSQRVAYPGYWATPRAGTCANIAEIAPQSLIVIVNGAPYAPYTHVLDHALGYKGTSFSSNIFNGRVFFSDMIRNVCAAGLLDSCEDEELDRLDDYVRTVALAPDSVAEEVWPLVQAMAAVDGESATELLTAIGASDHELAARARATLQANHA